MSEETEHSAPPEDAPAESERIAKRLARAGICSRRDAEKLIAEGRVKVNGKKLDTPAFVVTPADVVMVDGIPVGEPEKARVWRYNKPPGLVTSHKDEKGRATVFDKLPAAMPRVISVGRLDLTSEGLLLLTNDGALARSLELPAAGWVRRYRVRVHGEVDPEVLLKLENGVTVEGIKYGPIKALLERQKGSNAWLTVSLKEGKNREIRKVMEHMGWPVSRLIRVAYGPFQLGNLAEGEVEEVPTKVIKEQLGLGGTAWAKAEPDDRPQLPHKGPPRKGAPRTDSGRDNSGRKETSGANRRRKA